MASPQPNSKVIRVDNKTLAKLRKFKESKGGWSRALEAVLTDASTKPLWVLPSHLKDTKQVTRAQALKNAAANGLDLEDAETPIKVRRL